MSIILVINWGKEPRLIKLEQHTAHLLTALLDTMKAICKNEKKE
jgi:hypothetical protein